MRMRMAKHATNIKDTVEWYYIIDLDLILYFEKCCGERVTLFSWGNVAMFIHIWWM